jgi:pimeloyl-ACP methyl ester carboxylesterase
VLAKIRAGGHIDWLLAYDILRSQEWIDDIEAVRKAVVGSTGQISLYGRSGGSLLVHQYLAKYPDNVRMVFTQAAVNRFIDAEFRLNSDHFWDEIGQYDRSLQSVLTLTNRSSPERARSNSSTAATPELFCALDSSESSTRRPHPRYR